MTLYEFIILIVTSPITNVILTFLFFFQWYRQHAKEQSIKNVLFATRRILRRGQGTKEKAEDLIEVLDAGLATIGARKPFVRRVEEVLSEIKVRFAKESLEELEIVSNEARTSIQK